MKILFVHRDLPPDSYTGVAIQVHRLANALSALGHEVAVLTATARPSDARYRVIAADGPLLRLALAAAPVLKRLWYPLWFRSALRSLEGGFDAVHVHGDGGFLAYGGKYVRTFYGTAGLELRHARSLKGRLAQGLSFRMEKRECRLCRHTVGISPHIASYLPGVDKVIPCMLPGDPEAGEPAKTEYPSLLFLGSRFSRKRGELALDLFRRLKPAYPALRLTYVGPVSDAEASRGDPELAGVEFRNRIGQRELDALYRSSWIYLCLSSYEGFGVGLIEAMAKSCLVFTTPHPGSEYLVEGGVTGLVAPPERAQEILAKALSDRALRTAVTSRALAHSRRFAPGAVAQEYLSLYSTALKAA